MKKTGLVLLVSLLGLGTACTKDNDYSTREQTSSSSQPPDADNTARNKQTDPDALALKDTPLDQGETDADLRITSSIRKSIVNDKALSTDAHNIKIMTNAGKVTLRGPVKSVAERAKIEGYTKLTAGVDQIDNMLEVEKNP